VQLEFTFSSALKRSFIFNNNKKTHKTT